MYMKNYFSHHLITLRHNPHHASQKNTAVLMVAPQNNIFFTISIYICNCNSIYRSILHLHWQCMLHKTITSIFQINSSKIVGHQAVFVSFALLLIRLSS